MDDEEEDLWFLPAEPEDRAPTDLPWPMANRASVFDPNAWIKAEGQVGRELAAASAASARLDERLRMGPAGQAERLAIVEVEGLLWAQGERIPAERIALYLRLRESTVEGAQALASAGWAVRRMLGSAGPSDLATFLGRQAVEVDSLQEVSTRPVGIEFDGIAEAWQAIVDQFDDAHPMTQAAAAFHAWRAFGLSEPGDVIEGAVAAGKIGASGNRALQFLPIAMADRYALTLGGTAEERLRAWLKAVENACLRGLMMLEQLEEWRDRAREATAGLSGKTSPALIEVFVKSPMVSVAMGAKMTGASKAAVQRNLTKFDELGLITETTGQGRYRFWTVS